MKKKDLIYSLLIIIGFITFFGLLILGLKWMAEHSPEAPPCQNVKTIKALSRVANGNYLNTRTYVYDMTDGSYWEDVDGELRQRQPGEIICADDMR